MGFQSIAGADGMACEKPGNPSFGQKSDLVNVLRSQQAIRSQSLAPPLGSSVKWRMSKPDPLFLSQRSSYLRFYILDPPPGKLQAIKAF